MGRSNRNLEEQDVRGNYVTISKREEKCREASEELIRLALSLTNVHKVTAAIRISLGWHYWPSGVQYLTSVG